MARLKKGGSDEGRNGGTAHFFRFGDCEIDASTRELRRRNVPVKLRRQAFDLLLLLIRRQPLTVSLAEIRDTVWQRDVVATGSVARAVAEARRAIGDPVDDPQVIVNVHGVGYRFTSPLGDARSVPAAGESLPLRVIRDHLEQAEAAYERRAERALGVAHAEQALGKAMRHGLDVEAGKALFWLAWNAMAADRLEEAAQHAGHALHLAACSGNPTLHARARMADATVHLSLGNMGQAMAALSAAHPVLVADGRAVYRYQCETMLGRAARYLNDFDDALHWCLESERTARAGGLDELALMAVANQVALELEIGDSHEAAGRIEAARTVWQAALDRVSRLLDLFDVDIDAWVRVGCLANRGHLLGRMGRLAEARMAIQATADWLSSVRQEKLPAHMDARVHLSMNLAQLCLREGDPMQALAEMRAGIQLAEEQNYAGPLRPSLYQLGSSIAERCADLKLALHWARRYHEVHVARASERALIHAKMIRAQSQHDAVNEELTTMRARVDYLERMNAALLLRHPPAAPPSAGPMVSAGSPDDDLAP